MFVQEYLKVVLEHILKYSINIEEPNLRFILLGLGLELIYNVKKILNVHQTKAVLSQDKSLSSFLKKIPQNAQNLRVVRLAFLQSNQSLLYETNLWLTKETPINVDRLNLLFSQLRAQNGIDKQVVKIEPLQLIDSLADDLKQTSQKLPQILSSQNQLTEVHDPNRGVQIELLGKTSCQYLLKSIKGGLHGLNLIDVLNDLILFLKVDSICLVPKTLQKVISQLKSIGLNLLLIVTRDGLNAVAKILGLDLLHGGENGLKNRLNVRPEALLTLLNGQ